MLKVIINDDDRLFRQGLFLLLQTLFPDQKVTMRPDVNTATVAGADIIVLTLRSGEALICHPELFHRKHSLIMGLEERAAPDAGAPLPLCLSDILFIHRQESTADVSRKISHRWSLIQGEIPARAREMPRQRLLNCYGCPHRWLSQQQHRIAALLYRGASVDAIARELGVSDKTVCAHKHLIMSKFNLRSNFELLSFLRLLQARLTGACR
ncbi:helix-turn-helix transcriptional regulator [[Enterobacter] lignolyticus]|uniref:Transcriptional regulator, LuxR family n=1 Tax=Enterobacter lignolyticus (strain SCF1) TaxID=701347 RepID=E3G633_ENTLS|nr:LuxR C-terminal-related transcriptional regulator [[Enterobacter] lignolyticus]ADO48414.1 transcriptional regulator, LuxR family [[Enterobacter] lignolyticus SCF1]